MRVKRPLTACLSLVVATLCGMVGFAAPIASAASDDALVVTYTSSGVGNALPACIKMPDEIQRRKVRHARAKSVDGQEIPLDVTSDGEILVRLTTGQAALAEGTKDADGRLGAADVFLRFTKDGSQVESLSCIQFVFSGAREQGMPEVQASGPCFGAPPSPYAEIVVYVAEACPN